MGGKVFQWLLSSLLVMPPSTPTEWELALGSFGLEQKYGVAKALLQAYCTCIPAWLRLMASTLP